jgi:hypothetical protein
MSLICFSVLSISKLRSTEKIENGGSRVVTDHKEWNKTTLIIRKNGTKPHNVGQVNPVTTDGEKGNKGFW